jgi:hypothetical protein
MVSYASDEPSTKNASGIIFVLRNAVGAIHGSLLIGVYFRVRNVTGRQADL